MEWIEIVIEGLILLGAIIGTVVVIDRRVSKVEIKLEDHLNNRSIHEERFNELEKKIVPLQGILSELRSIHKQIERMEKKNDEQDLEIKELIKNLYKK